MKSTKSIGDEIEDSFCDDDTSERVEDDEIKTILASLSNFLNEEENNNGNN